MTLPASFLQHVEQHPCFTGCYGSDPDVRVCLDPSQPLVPLIVVSCRDCFARFGVPNSLLPVGVSSYNLADHLTQHLRTRRGFQLSFSGYFTAGPGFWLSAAYYPCGLFLLDGNRSRSLGSDLDLLLLAFKHGIIQPLDPRMTDPKMYTVQTLHVNYGQSASGIINKQVLIGSPQVRTRPVLGWQKVTLAEFLPVTTAPPAPASARPTNGTTAATALAGKPAATSAPPSNGTKVAAKPTLRLGDVCPVCKAEVRIRSLLNGTFVGCLC